MNKVLHRLYIGLFFVTGLAALALLTYNGYSYYSLPVEERFFAQNHEALKPSGVWGHAFGILGTLFMIIGVSVYMIRKRVRFFFSWGFLKHWLEFHIFLCTVGPLLVLFHTAFKFGGIVAISFWSMVAVVLSGVVGRFIYVQIPRTIEGNELNYTQMNKLNESAAMALQAEGLLNPALLLQIEQLSSPERFRNIGFRNGAVVYLALLRETRALLTAVKRELAAQKITTEKSLQVRKLVSDKLLLGRRIGFLRTMQRLFHYWHVFHLPFAIAMFVIMVIHVAVTIVFGYRWIF